MLIITVLISSTMLICEFNCLPPHQPSAGVPDPPFGCSSTQTNTTLTISCKAGFHQGDPDYFCYLELFDRIAQQFVEIARKKQSCVFLLTEFRPQGIHTYRLYTENRHGSNKADSIIIRIGEEKVPKSNERWKIMSITLGILAGVSALVLIGFIIYRMAMPVTDFSTLIESNRRDLYSNDQKQLDRIYLPSSRIRRGSQSMGRYLRNDQHGTSCDDSFRRPRSYPFNHELSHSTDELTRGAKYNAGAQNDPSLALQRRASENRAYVISDCRLTATRNKSLTVDNVSYANTNTRLCKYTMYNPKSEDSLLCEHRQTNHPLGNRGLPLHPQHHHNHNHSQSVKIFDHQQHQQQPHSGQSSSLTFKTAITSRRCEDGGVFV